MGLSDCDEEKSKRSIDRLVVWAEEEWEEERNESGGYFLKSFFSFGEEEVKVK